MFGSATRHLLKNSGAVFILRLLGMGLSYVAIMFIGNQFGATVYGRFSLLQALLQFSVVIFSLGIDILTVKLTADLRFFENKTPKNTYLLNAFLVLLGTGLLGSFLFYLLKEPLAIKVFKDPNLVAYFDFLWLFFLGALFHNFLAEFLRGRHRFVGYGFFKFLLPPLIFLVLIYLFWEQDYAESSLFLAYLLGFVALVVPLLYFVPFKRLNTSSKYSRKEMLRIAFPMMFSAAFLFLSNWTDVFMLGAMVSKADVGIYNTAYKLAIIALVAINAVNTILGPKISQLFSTDNHEAIRKEVQRATKLITYITLPITTILIVFGKYFLSLFGEAFVAGYSALVIIAIGLLFNAMSGSVGQVLNMTQHQQILKRFTIISVVVNIVLNYILIKQLGYIGAAYASVVSNITLNLLCVFYIRKHLAFNAFFIPWK